MSREARQVELREQTQRLLRGALKHARAAALAATLVPLGAVAVVALSPATAQAQSGGTRVPEPATLALLGVGAGAVGAAAWWRQRGKK